MTISLTRKTGKLKPVAHFLFSTRTVEILNDKFGNNDINQSLAMFVISLY
ncbi:hypothetical protein [cyanobacterium endosymbiont of Rhopalodia gibberula]|nr:hypothetical protein [cyanobacterium endosymbiont of Rhopalodia gibberula]